MFPCVGLQRIFTSYGSHRRINLRFVLISCTIVYVFSILQQGPLSTGGAAFVNFIGPTDAYHETYTQGSHEYIGKRHIRDLKEQESVLEGVSEYEARTRSNLKDNQLGQGRTRVLLFCYMRGGSTYFSEFFRNNPDVLYWYEPLDALYSHVAGMQMWNFPGYWYGQNGTVVRRPLQDWEITEVSKFTDELLRCNIDNLPTNLLLHSDLLTRCSKLDQYIHCIDWKKAGIHKCYTNTSEVCKGFVFWKMKCREKVSFNRELVLSKDNFRNATNSHLYDQKFYQASKCVKDMENLPKPCLHHLEEACESSKIITYKGLRLTMYMVGKLMEKDPGLKVVYYVRDPRATVSSRLDYNPSDPERGRKSIWETYVLGTAMKNDYYDYLQLKSLYPSSISMFRYEDLVQDPIEVIKMVYQSFGSNVHPKVIEWVHSQQNVTDDGNFQSTKRKNSTERIDLWKNKYSPEDRVKMRDNCVDTLDLFGYSKDP